ncbi:uncharacterized protein CMU_014390 [Cryptosporidium muris RN66]|uniref:Uncharacterized protein n=1 Tax=Cryptosporidium muris (strain RN66) TaxID=441375 RepID=B6AEZ6_CRYMR|nr:uncharacterized protein CMU_014390 [Cryptosporidium muris RN66]EEA06763.1 hypothetical protein, conserved [Cryptosporidium muris RN66]|eukprot:XP_002141112.1 hypothetical protein [Cryptosporidium muris RN66]
MNELEASSRELLEDEKVIDTIVDLFHGDRCLKKARLSKINNSNDDDIDKSSNSECSSYIRNPILHELLRGRDNKSSDLDRSIPDHLLWKISQKVSEAPNLWRTLWARKSLFDIIKGRPEDINVHFEKLCFHYKTIRDQRVCVSVEEYSPPHNWSYYIWWLIARRPEMLRLLPKLPGYTATSIASMEWKLLPSLRPDILSEFKSSIEVYKASNPLPKSDEPAMVQREYIHNAMMNLRTSLSGSFSEWLVPYYSENVELAETHLDNFQNKILNNYNAVIKSNEAQSYSIFDSFPTSFCRDIDRTFVKKKGNLNMVLTHQIPHLNTSDCTLQNQVYNNVFVEEYSNVSLSIAPPSCKVDIYVGMQVQFVFDFIHLEKSNSIMNDNNISGIQNNIEYMKLSTNILETEQRDINTNIDIPKDKYGYILDKDTTLETEQNNKTVDYPKNSKLADTETIESLETDVIKVANDKFKNQINLVWMNGIITEYSEVTGEICITSSDQKYQIKTLINCFVPPSIPVVDIRVGWWRFPPNESSDRDLVPGSVVCILKEISSQKMLDAVVISKYDSNETSVNVYLFQSKEIATISPSQIVFRLAYDIHPTSGIYISDSTVDLSSWFWCIPRPLSSDHPKSPKGRWIIWLVSFMLDLVTKDPMLCYCIQQDLVFNRGFLWDPLPITCFTEATLSKYTSETDVILHDVDSILDMPLNLLI